MAVEGQRNEPNAPTSAPSADSNRSADIPAKPSKRACDCCRKRKVKCDGAEPCTPCKKASIRCAYLQPPKKKGPKGLRSARVLHALRTIDDTANAAVRSSPLGPNAHGAFGNWNWNANNGSPTAQHFTPDQSPHPPQVLHGPHTSMAPNESYYFQRTPTAIQTEPSPHPKPGPHPQLYRQEPDQQTWATQAESVPAITGSYPVTSSYFPDLRHQRLSGDEILPYVRLFFTHMFPIMPVIDRSTYLDPTFYANSDNFSSDTYCFLCALCAATSVQLETSIPQPSQLYSTKSNDDVFAEECLRERKNYDYVETRSTLSVMIPFFLFAYYGNHEKHNKAWYYLQESITAAENLNLEDEGAYAKLDPTEAQWRRRLHWLLFITERAYAVQRRKHTRLHASVQLPTVFEGEDPQMLNGFVNLAILFSAVDDSFVSAWRGSRRQSLCNETWLAQTQKQLDAAALAQDNISEMQHLDISVTREWLHVLTWQMGVSNGLIWGKGEGGMRLDYPIELARKVVETTSGASSSALDSHGIGMEQKLSDIAGCLADVLRCTAGDTSETFQEGKQYLNILVQTLSSMRGKESRYLKPLMAKVDGLIGYELNNQTLPLPTELTPGYPTVSGAEYFASDGRRLTLADSVGMLRTLSMSGHLGMPSLSVTMLPQEDWQQRRPSGRVYDEAETSAIGDWTMLSGSAGLQAA